MKEKTYDTPNKEANSSIRSTSHHKQFKSKSFRSKDPQEGHKNFNFQQQFIQQSNVLSENNNWNYADNSGFSHFNYKQSDHLQNRNYDQNYLTSKKWQQFDKNNNSKTQYNRQKFQQNQNQFRNCKLNNDHRHQNKFSQNFHKKTTSYRNFLRKQNYKYFSKRQKKQKFPPTPHNTTQFILNKGGFKQDSCFIAEDFRQSIDGTFNNNNDIFGSMIGLINQETFNQDQFLKIPSKCDYNQNENSDKEYIQVILNEANNNENPQQLIQIIEELVKKLKDKQNQINELESQISLERSNQKFIQKNQNTFSFDKAQYNKIIDDIQ